MHKTQQTKLIKSHLFTLILSSITRSSLLGSGLPRNRLKLHQITIVSLFVIVIGVLSSTVPLAHADSVEVVMAKGTATNQQCGDQCFVPNTVSIKAETIVIWKNDDSAAHTATATHNSFDTGIVNAGATKSITFHSGTHQYYCMVHPWMKGTIVVDDPSIPLTPTISTDNIITFIIKTDPNASANTDKYEYLAGETVNINGYNFVGNQPITIQILDSNQNKLAELTSGSSQTGVIQETWKIPVDLKSGQYVIQMNAPSIEDRIPIEVPSSAQLTIGGKIKSLIADNRISVTLRIVGPLINGESGSIVTVKQTAPMSDGSYSDSMILGGPLWTNKGDYKIIANYGPYRSETIFTFDGESSEISAELPILGAPDEDQSDAEEILIESTEDGSIYALITPIKINSHRNLTFELSFEDVDDNPIEHVNFDIVAIQNSRQILQEARQHTHSGTVEFTTATLNSDDPVDIEIRILGIGLPDDSAHWIMATKETLALRIVDFNNIDHEYEEPTPTDLPYRVDVSIPSGSSSPNCERINQCYTPVDVSVAAGGEVIWSNDDSASHTVTSGYPNSGPDGKFDSGLFLSGQTFTHTFNEEGEFPYFCLVHPWMQGTVFVGQGNGNPIPNPVPIPTPTPNIDLTVNLKKSEYDLGEVVPLFIAISGVSSPQNVAITVTDPFGTVMVSRTLTTDFRSNAVTDFKIAESFKTGTYRIDATSSINGITYSTTSEFNVISQFNQIQILSAQGTDLQGNPMEFSRGNMGFVKVQVNAQKPIATLITVNVFDSDLTPLGVGSLKTTLNTGQSELILSFMIPQDAVVGTADIYVNALSDWVSAGGIPQTGEFAGQVRIN